MKEKNKVERLILPVFKTYYKATISNQDDYRIGERIDKSLEQNRELGNRPHTCSQPIFDREAKTIQWENTVFSANDVGTTEHLYVKSWIYTQTLYPFTKINYKDITDLIVNY